MRNCKSLSNEVLPMTLNINFISNYQSHGLLHNSISAEDWSQVWEITVSGTRKKKSFLFFLFLLCASMESAITFNHLFSTYHKSPLSVLNIDRATYPSVPPVSDTRDYSCRSVIDGQYTNEQANKSQTNKETKQIIYLPL